MATAVAEQTALDLDWDLAYHLGDPDSVRQLQAEQVKADVIEDHAVREIFDWQMAHVREHGFPATPTVLAEEFSSYENYEPEAAIGDLISRLRERFIRNEGRERIRNLADLAINDPLSLSKELTRFGRELTEITARRGESFSTGDYHRAMEEYLKMANRGEGPSIVGFKEIDDHFNGQVGVTFLIAPPKSYKSWFCCKGVHNNTLQGRKSKLYSLELPAKDTDWRLRCLAADVPYWKYLKGCLSIDDQKRVKETSQFMEDQGLYNVEKPKQGERGVQRLIERALNEGAEVIYIDQLQYLENRKGGTIGALNNTGDYFEVVNDLRNYSDEVPIFVVHQFNRSVMSATGMPEMQQGKGSSAIEEVATLALGLWASKEMRQENEIEIGTLASRNYSYASWRLGVQLSAGCDLTMRHRVGEEDDE